MRATEAEADKPVNVRAGNLLIRMAESPAEVRAAQALRYRVFCEEMGSKSTAEMTAARREFDSFDAHCEHLLVFDLKRAGSSESVVATYRMMRREAAAQRGQFYSSGEYDVSSILDYPGEVLEVGRSCVHPDFRRGSTMQLLWRGIAEYVFHYDIRILFGCASLPGIDLEANALPLTYLYHHHLAPPELRATALPELYVDMRRVAPEAVDEQAAKAMLPPLIKGYLRLGGYVGDGAVIDREFNTTDVCVMVKTDWVTEKYFKHYARKSTAKPQS